MNMLILTPREDEYKPGTQLFKIVIFFNILVLNYLSYENLP